MQRTVLVNGQHDRQALGHQADYSPDYSRGGAVVGAHQQHISCSRMGPLSSPLPVRLTAQRLGHPGSFLDSQLPPHKVKGKYTCT
eukprot:1158248-Pelagomonas_calceolata.AAC.3